MYKYQIFKLKVNKLKVKYFNLNFCYTPLKVIFFLKFSNIHSALKIITIYYLKKVINKLKQLFT